jgi:hypothetical protein
VTFGMIGYLLVVVATHFEPLDIILDGFDRVIG